MPDQSDVNPFFSNLCQLIEGTEKIIRSTTHNYEPLQEDAINYVEGAFYSNLIRLFQNNLNDKFFNLVKMEEGDRATLENELDPFFKRAKETSESVYNKGEVDFFLYQDFRKAVYGFGDDVYWLLLGVEKHADIIRCEHRIIQFKNDLIRLQKSKRKKTS